MVIYNGYEVYPALLRTRSGGYTERRSRPGLHQRATVYEKAEHPPTAQA